jgi:CheY-like chemotaxis protein
MNCPRCKTAIPPLVDPDSIVTCAGCGSRLMTRSAAMRSQGARTPQSSPPRTAQASPPPARPAAAKGPPAAASAAPTAVVAAELPPSATLPPTPARLLSLRKGLDELPLPNDGPRTEGPSKRKGAAGRAGAAPEPPLPAAAPATPLLNETLELLVREMRALRATQEQILALLERGHLPASGGSAPLLTDSDANGLSPIRAVRRKTVVLVDDDPATRAAAVAELEQADVPVRAYDEGNAALSGIAEEKPDVIVIELALGGEMAGKDVINVIKATMEWVDVPIVLWTRESVQNQKEARQIHGADEIVPKSAGAGALVARVITVFRRV